MESITPRIRKKHPQIGFKDDEHKEYTLNVNRTTGSDSAENNSEDEDNYLTRQRSLGQINKRHGRNLEVPSLNRMTSQIFDKQGSLKHVTSKVVDTQGSLNRITSRVFESQSDLSQDPSVQNEQDDALQKTLSRHQELNDAIKFVASKQEELEAALNIVVSKQLEMKRTLVLGAAAPEESEPDDSEPAPDDEDMGNASTDGGDEIDEEEEVKTRVALPSRSSSFSCTSLKNRLLWAKKIKKCGGEMWNDIIFFDKRRFTIVDPCGPVGLSVTVWSAVCSKAKHPLIRCEQPMKTMSVFFKYLKDDLIPFANESYDSKFYFQCDKASVHNAKAIDRYLKQEGYQSIEWPSNSHDISPFKKIWQILAKKVNKKDKAYKTEDELFEALEAGWEKIKLETMQEAISEMSDNIEKIVKNKGMPVRRNQ